MSLYLVIKYVIESETPAPDEKPQIVSKLTPAQETALLKQLRFTKDVSDYAKRKGWRSKEPPIRFYIDKPDQYYIAPSETIRGKRVKICYVRIPIFVAITFPCRPDCIIYPNTYKRQTYKFTENLLEHQVPMVLTALSHLKQYKTTTLGVYTGAGKNSF